MKYIKLLCFLAIFISIAPSVSAYTPVSIAQEAGSYAINISERYTTTGTQIILNFPYDPNNIYQWGKVQKINAIGINVGRGTIDPNNNLKIRIYSYDSLYNYILEEEITYTVNQHTSNCLGDWACGVHIYLNNEINVTSNTGYAIGVYSESTSGDWYVFGNPNTQQFFNLPSTSSYNGLSTSVNYANGTIPAYSDSFFSININYIDVFFYGTFLFPPTPTPPIQPPDNPLPCPECTENNSALPEGGSDEGNFFNPYFENSTQNCPTCIGNETRLVSNTIEPSSGFCTVLIPLGYGSSEGCTTKSFIDFMYDYSILFFLLSLILLFYKIYLIGAWK